MRYREIRESISSTAKFLAAVKKTLASHQDIIWHQTGTKSAEYILADGFKTGAELQRGEGTGAIFFTPVFHRSVSYNRDSVRGAGVYLPCLITGMKIISQDDLAKTITLDPANRNMVDKGIWAEDYARKYQVTLMMDDGDIPDGLDGIVKSRLNGVNGAYCLTKEAANLGLKAALLLVNEG
jgi:hypothetical protein